MALDLSWENESRNSRREGNKQELERPTQRRKSCTTNYPISKANGEKSGLVIVWSVKC